MPGWKSDVPYSVAFGSRGVYRCSGYLEDDVTPEAVTGRGELSWFSKDVI